MAITMFYILLNCLIVNDSTLMACVGHGSENWWIAECRFSSVLILRHQETAPVNGAVRGISEFFWLYFSGISPLGLNLRTISRIRPMVNRRICAALSIKWAFSALPSGIPTVIRFINHRPMGST